MKILLLVTILFASFSALAIGPCDGKDYCVEKPSLFSRFTSDGIYYAKGIGKNCEEAFNDARQALDHSFDQLSCDERGNIKCGNNGAPFKWNYGYGPTCYKQKNGKHVVWAQCDNIKNSFSTKPKPASRCVMVGNGRVGRLLCGGF